VNETTEAAPAPVGAEDLALRQLHHVGWAYALIFVLVFAYAWKTATATRRLRERVDEIERDRARR
jgi:hypothetical protein